MTFGTTALLLGLVAAEPRILDPAYELTLVVSEPGLVTPVGLTFDDRGRLLVIESHTHFRPEGYEGPPADRIRLVEDTNGDGKADRLRSFYEGTTFTMGLRPGPDGWVYVATRREVFRLKDADGDGTAEVREDVIRLETTGDYPHNGLSGLAFGPDDKLWFGMGENLGEPYELVGKLYIGMGQNRGEQYDLVGEGNRLSGGGEGGNVFRCDLDGGNLERIATGFWNPFGLCFDAHGRLFAVDNDPDASPPCRLLHVVPGGDYGFQFRYGRAGRHPLQAWDGELPGTLPMAAGTGEAPSGVVPHEGKLWVTSWGHHRIERYSMRPDGATVVGAPEVVVQGDENFRPVDLAVGPDGALYFTDWVDKSYPLHGKGRLWRLRRVSGTAEASEIPALSDAERKAANARTTIDLTSLASDDPFLHQAAVWGLVTANDLSGVRWEELSEGRQRLGLLEARRWRDDLSDEARDGLLAAALDDPDPDVRLYALRWIADERLVAFRDRVAALLDRPDAAPRLLRTVVAVLDRLDGDRAKPDDPLAGLVAILDGADRPAALRAAALRSFPADHPALTVERLGKLAASDDASLSREAVRNLAAGNGDGRFTLLASIARDETRPAGVRADAVLGLAADASRHRDLLTALSSEPSVVGEEARRALSPAPTAEESRPSPDDLAAWQSLVGEGGDPEAGWRVFFRPNGANCSRCHTLGGRGIAVGPDLTGIGRRMGRDRLLESILRPSREVAPQYVPWTLVTTDGRVVTGLPVEVRDAEPGIEHFVGTDGVRFTLRTAEIETRQASPGSVMPDGLEKLLTAEELRDLLALLATE